MPEMVTANGTKIAIGPVAPDTVDTSGEFAALTPWVEIGMVENVGEFGDESSVVTANVLTEWRTRKAKGVKDAGGITLTLLHAPTDLGQAALKAAEQTAFNYAFRITLPNRLNPTGTDEINYFRALVTTRRLTVGGTDNPLRRVFNLAINGDVIEVPPTAGS